VGLAEKVHDYLQIQFDDGSGLSIYNDAQLIGTTELHNLVGLRVEGVQQEPMFISLILGKTAFASALAITTVAGQQL
jgi:hypothetical protein